MSIIGIDPFAFLTSQGGVVGSPLKKDAADGVDNLDTQQRGAVIGEPIPIVFCRRVSGVGGVLINPPATEARFTDDASSNITASYLLVLSDGQIDSIQVRDVFQGACRVGSYTQTYNRRAGTFVPGNFIDNTPNLRAPTYCGTGGTYAGLSTMAFTVTIPAGFDQWNRQVYCFIRGGIYVPRLLDSITGPSNNVADLLLYLLRNSSRVPEAMIDTTSLLAAATFTNVNGFWFNGVLKKSTNLREWIRDTLQYFLLRQARIGGKEALKPLVQINANGTIKTTAVSWVFTFKENHIIPDSFDITYTPLADRKPFCAVMLWRQQDDLGIPVMRTTEVRYTGTAIDGPFEQHDLSGFCSTENHAVKVGAYILSKRRHVTHRLQIGVKPDAYNPTLAVGDLVRVRLERIASTGPSSLHDYLYEVDRIGKSITGDVRLELTHFPVNSNLASVVALEVNAAVGSGLIVGTGLSAITCDINSFNDTTVPPETFTSGSFPTYSLDLGEQTESGLEDAGAGGGDGDGAGESGDGDLTFEPPANTVPNATPGNDACAPVICEGGIVRWYRLDPSVPGGKVYLTQGPCYTMIINDIDKSVYSEIECPDPSSPTGLGPPISTTPFTVIQPCRANPVDQFPGITGTISPTGTNTFTWTNISYSYKLREPSDGSCPNPEARQMYYSTVPGGSATIAGGCTGLILQTRLSSDLPYGAPGGGQCGGLGGGFPGGVRWAVEKFNGDLQTLASQGGGSIDLFSWQLIGLTVTSSEPNAIDAPEYFGDCG